MTTPTAATTTAATALEPKSVVYCGACGMPPEYCEYGPDYESHCNPWLLKHHPDIYATLRNNNNNGNNSSSEEKTAVSKEKVVEERPTKPWTVKERLTAFYGMYQPDKVDGVAALLEKYEGKEEKLFAALVTKYGKEPRDPYYVDNDDESVSEEEEEDGFKEKDDDMSREGGTSSTRGEANDTKRRGAAAKRVHRVDTRVVIQKISRNRKKAVTVVLGMDTVPDVKLKDVAKAFSKRFAGSSSVKDTAIPGVREIIIQGDHMYDVADMIVDKFNVSTSSVFLDMDGEFVPFK